MVCAVNRTASSNMSTAFANVVASVLNTLLSFLFFVKRCFTPKLSRFGKPLPEFSTFSPEEDVKKYESRKNAHEIYVQWVLGERLVVLLTADLAKQFYKTGLGSKAHNNFFGYAYQRFFDVMLGAKDGEEWRQLKLPLMNFYSYAGVKSNMNVIDRETTAWLHNFEEKMKLTNVFSVSELGIETQARTLLGSLMYGELSQADKDLIEKVSNLNLEAMETVVDYSSRYQWFTNTFHTSTVELVDRTWQLWETWNREKIHEYEVNPDKPVTLFSEMGTYDCYKDERVYFQTMYEMLILNLDIMAHALSNLLYELASRPYLQEEIYKELLQNSPEPLSYLNSLDDLPLVRSVINETSRLKSALDFTLPETLTDDWALDGITIPAGTRISQNPTIINRDPMVFDNPDEFDPYRFYGPEGVSKLLTFHRFGLGSRKCLGHVYANFVLAFSVDRIVRNYTMRLVQAKPQTEERGMFPIVNKLVLVNNIEFKKRQ